MKSWWDYQWDYPFWINLKLSWDNPFCSDGVFHMHCLEQVRGYTGRFGSYVIIWSSWFDHETSHEAPTGVAEDHGTCRVGAWNWKSLQNAFWDLHKMFYWAFFFHVGLAKTPDHFVENLYRPKCRPNKFSDDHFVDPGYRRLLCTYKKREHKYTPWIVTGIPFEKCTRWRKVCGRSAKDQIGDSIYIVSTHFFFTISSERFAKGARKMRERRIHPSHVVPKMGCM